MAQSNNNIQSSNRMTARQLVISENASLEMRENPNTGKYFFVCGSKKGYISPAAQKALLQGKGIDDFQYAEVSINGGAAVPCLMVVGNSNANLKVRLGEELLH
jgi:hypothetical protein